MILSEQPTTFLIRALPVYLGSSRRPCRCQGAGRCCSRSVGIAFGAWSDSLDAAAAYVQQKADEAMTQAANTLSYMAALPGETAGRAIGWAQDQMLQAQAKLAQAYNVAIDTGLSGAGKIVSEMSSRVGGAMANLGAGAGAAFESFLGFRPKDFYTGLFYLALAGLALAGLFYFSPSGTALFSGLGRGYAATGEGVGRGIGGLLGNPDKLASVFAKVL